MLPPMLTALQNVSTCGAMLKSWKSTIPLLRTQVFELELPALAFGHSLHPGDSDLYKDTLTKLSPWVFSLNHIHYAPQMSVHVRDMCGLNSIHPGVAQELVWASSSLLSHKGNPRLLLIMAMSKITCELKMKVSLVSQSLPMSYLNFESTKGTPMSKLVLPRSYLLHRCMNWSE